MEEEITNLLNILKEEYLKIWADLSLIPAFKNPEEKFVNLDPDKVRLWKDIWVRVKEYIPPIKDKLKKEFQKALGFSKNE